MQQTIHGNCTELTAFVCEHLSVCLHNPFSQEAACCIHHHHRKHTQDQLFLQKIKSNIIYFTVHKCMLKNLQGYLGNKVVFVQIKR